MKISLIVAHGTNNELGLDGGMLWHISSEFKHFKEMTYGHSLLMGRKTFDSIGKCLPGRTTYILTRSGDLSRGEARVVSSFEQALIEAREQNCSTLFICGGGEIYQQVLDLGIVDELHLSVVNYSGEADTYFPNIDKSDWKLEESFDNTEDKKYSWKYFRYQSLH